MMQAAQMTKRRCMSQNTQPEVLKKADFQTGSTQLVAPLALTAFKGSAESPEVLCSINLDGQAGQFPRCQVVHSSFLRCCQGGGASRAFGGGSCVCFNLLMLHMNTYKDRGLPSSREDDAGSVVDSLGSGCGEV